MVKLIAYLVIALLGTGLLTLAWLYITGNKFRKPIPKAFFLNGPLEGENLIVGPFKDTILLNLPGGADVEVFAVYDHIGNGTYWHSDTVWESEFSKLGLDKSQAVSYNDLTTEQEDSDDTTNDSGESDRPANLG